MKLLPVVTASQIVNGCVAATLPLTRRCASDVSSPGAPLAAQYSSTFDVDVIFANQTFKLLVDTGSSDTYVVRTGFQCINATTNLEIPEADCLYSPQTYNQSSTYRPIPNETFGVQYGNGIASGVMAYEDITLAGITVKGQAVGIADHSNPMGDGANSGVLGLAYPSLTSAHPGNDTDNTTFFYNRAVYSPVFNTLYGRGLVDSYFSIALAHTPLEPNISTPTFGGYLTLGDLPPVAHSPNFSIVPVEILAEIPTEFTSGHRTRSYWAFTVSAVTYGEPNAQDLTTNATAFQAFTDTGNELSFLPAAVVEPINARFAPPAVYDDASGVYVVDCDAEAPTFGVTIGDQTFYHEGRDLIYQTGDGTCVSALAASESVAYEGIVLNILGASFLKNVVSVYDFGRNELRFAQRLGL
ncbi:acid protease [Aspergillus uvarum CBS 121591]|uniref:Acid protease n=1 Tax=Aspergillus uvarum CBS 121591 TaxID=1448315 RepID=A0A319CU62_9EURO|nr:acid protease [Aspergillus uvarum CBS 121591]PYH86267.1 acid protease [Aspergillus uvarum CBS 121591]